jgi:hypothetical protein
MMPKGQANTKDSSTQPRIVVLGAGVGGIGAALALANDGYNVTLIEQRAAMLEGTSNKTPARAGLGFHYVDYDSAALYLKATFDVANRHPECLLGAQKEASHFLNHSIYFLMKEKNTLPEADKKFGSLFAADRILETYEKLRELYKTLVEEKQRDNPDYTPPFGAGDDFFTVTRGRGALEKFKGIINTDAVEAVVDTREVLLDWSKMKLKLLQQVQDHANIEVRISTKATFIEVAANTEKTEFLVHLQSGESIRASQVVNSSWENVDALNQSIGIPFVENARSNRLKAIITVELPPPLLETPTVFFAIGPHMTMTNLGNGFGKIIYEPINDTASTALYLPDNYQRLTTIGPTAEEREHYEQRILNGAITYIPALRGATITSLDFGIVQTKGTVNINDAKSSIHSRRGLGAERGIIGFTVNRCMKLLHFEKNALEVANIVEKDQESIKKIDALIQSRPEYTAADKNKLRNKLLLASPADLDRMIEQHQHGAADTIQYSKINPAPTHADYKQTLERRPAPWSTRPINPAPTLFGILHQLRERAEKTSSTKKTENSQESWLIFYYKEMKMSAILIALFLGLMACYEKLHNGPPVCNSDFSAKP